MNSQKIINLLTICRKSGKLVTGFDISLDSVISGKSRCLLLASNLSQKTVKELNYQIQREGLENRVKLLTIPLTIDEIAWYINAKVGVIAICDNGFSKSFEKLLSENS